MEINSLDIRISGAQLWEALKGQLPEHFRGYSLDRVYSDDFNLTLSLTMEGSNTKEVPF